LLRHKYHQEFNRQKGGATKRLKQKLQKWQRPSS